MFRNVASKVLSLSSSSASLSSSHTFRVTRACLSSNAPSVKDLLIDLTFVDPSGARRKVKGLVGKTLHEICDMQGIDIGPASIGGAPEMLRTEAWTEPTFGEGVTSGYDHVVLVGKGAEHAVRKTPIETQMLDDHWDWDEIFAGSRLASAVRLTKEMDGMTVYVPDRIVDDIP